MDPVIQMLINDYGIDPRTAALMAQDASAQGNMQMSGGVSAAAMGPAMRDSASSGIEMPNQYQNQVPAFANASQNRVNTIDSGVQRAQSAMAPVYNMLRGNQQAQQGGNAQALADSIAPRPAPYNPANDPTGQGMAAHGDLNDSVDRGAGFDPQAAGRFKGQAGGSPTVGPKQPDYHASVNKYQQQLNQQLGPERGAAMFRQQMMQQKAQLQAQMAAIDGVLKLPGGGMEMGDVSVRNAPSMEMGQVSVKSVPPKFGAK